MIDARALDIYQVDLARNGFTDADYIEQRVQEIGARLCNHCYTSPVTAAASLHWLSTCRDAFLFEDCVEDSPLRHELTQERIQAVDGVRSAPEGPGLGVTLNEDFIDAHLVAESGSEQQGAGNGKPPRPHTQRLSAKVKLAHPERTACRSRIAIAVAQREPKLCCDWSC